MTRAIITDPVYPPIPIRSCDWRAYWEGDEERPGRYAYGATEEEAIAALLEEEEE